MHTAHACSATIVATCLFQVRNLLVGERERLHAGLSSISWLEPYPSQANFILAKVWADSGVACPHALNHCRDAL